MLNSVSCFSCQSLISSKQNIKRISFPFLEAIQTGREATFQALCMPPTWESSFTRGARCAGTQQMRWSAQRHKGTKAFWDARRAVKGSKKTSDAQWWSKKKRRRRRNKERGVWLRLKEFPERALYIERWIKCRIASSPGLLVAFPAEWRRCHRSESSCYRDYAAPPCRAKRALDRRV